MNERLKYVRQEYKITRRDLNHALVTLGGALLASEAIKVLSPANEDFGRIEEIAEETHQKLRQFNPVTVAHRGANTFDRLGQSIDAGVNFAEADVRSSLGRLVITHEEEWQLLAYDLCRRLIGLSGVVPNIEELARRTKAEKQKLFLDIKENSADLIERVVEKVYQYELQFQVSYFATTWQVLDRVGQFTGRADNLFYSIGDKGDLRLFLDQQPKNARQGVALDTSLAQEEIVRDIHNTGARVLAAVVGNSKEALKVLDSGIEGIVSPNLSLLGIWSKRPPPRYFA